MDTEATPWFWILASHSREIAGSGVACDHILLIPHMSCVGAAQQLYSQTVK